MVSPSPMQFPGLQPATQVGTAYAASMAAKRTPFAAAKYGLGGFTPARPQVTPGGLTPFSPSGEGISAPRLQPLQFGGKSSNAVASA